MNSRMNIVFFIIIGIFCATGYRDGNIICAIISTIQLVFLLVSILMSEDLFHWFEKDKFREECNRILRGKKMVAILRISNNTDADKEIDKMRHYTEQDIQSAKEFFRDGFFEHTVRSFPVRKNLRSLYHKPGICPCFFDT